MHDWQGYVRTRLGPLPCAPEREAEIVEELALQLEQVYRRATSAGASDAEAYADAEAEVADWRALAATLVQPQPAPSRPAGLRSASGSGWLGDLRYAQRALRAAPTFTCVVILTLALGAGATTAMFSLVDRVVLAPLPFPDADELMLAQQVVPPIRDRYPVLGANLRSIRAWQEGCRTSCAAIATLEGLDGTLSVRGEPQGIVGARVSANALDVFGIRPFLGRGFRSTDMVDGSDRVILLSHEIWQQRFGSDPNVIGRTVTVNDVDRQIVGVLPDDPRLPRLERLTPVRRWIGRPQVLVPFVPSPGMVQSAGDFSYIAILRLRPSVTAAQAHDELTPLTHAAFGDAPFRPEVLIQPVGDYVVRTARQPLWLLLGAVGAMLMVACLNVANLAGGRWLTRRRELAIRLALGAQPSDLVRHVAAEAVWLAAAGGVLAIAFAALALRLVLGWAPVEIPRVEEVTFELRALAFGLGVTTLCTFVSCVLPVRRLTAMPSRQLLDAGGHSTSDPPRALHLRRALVGLEVATSVTLLVVAGLLLVSFVRVNGLDRGFVSEGRLAVDLNLSGLRYAKREARTQLIERLIEAVQAVPGVAVAAVAQKLPLEGEASVDLFVPEGTKQFDGPQPVGSHFFVSPGYFRALQLRVVAGRTFTGADRQRRVAVIGEAAARTLWPHASAIGQRFSRSRPQEIWEVIGVVADTHTEKLERGASLVSYVPHWDWERSSPQLSIIVRTAATPDTMLPSVRRAIASVDGALAVLNPRTMNDVVSRATAARRFQMWLTIAFAAAGLTLACLGIYGVVSAAVVRRRSELAVRTALGASARHIARTVLAEALIPVVAGLAAGAAGAAAVGSLIAALLFGVSPYDPAVFSGVAALILVSALAACTAPLVRALRTSPILAIRGG
jgi:putative ABC transport system permease protein